ncbi:hypothetical protein FQZ97_797620 [compost metagenome]
MLIARVDVIEEQEEPGQAAIHVRRREVEGVVVVEQRTQRLARVADAILELVEAGVDIAVVVILELAGRGQRRTGFDGAVVVPRKTIALRRRMGVVQVRGNFRGAETDVILRQPVVDAQDHRLAIACENSGSRSCGAPRITGIAPDLLGRIGRIEHPVRPLPGRQFVRDRDTQFGKSLVGGTACLAGGGIRLLSRRRVQSNRLEHRDFLRELDLPRNGGRARRDQRTDIVILVVISATPPSNQIKRRRGDGDCQCRCR